MFARHSRPLACTFVALSLAALNGAARADSDGDRERDRSRDRTVTVDCASGDTISRALTKGDERKSLTILISGTCSESVTINRSDIKLAAAAPGATVSGPDPAVDTIRVTGSRVTIDGLTVTGGRNGITGDGAAGLIVQNALVQGTGRTGIAYLHGASGIVDHVVVQNNTVRDGIAIESAYAAVINSQISLNGRHGIGVFDAGGARIGVDNASNAAGNVITGNTVNGIHIVFGSSAFIGMNQISGNGNPTSQGGISGFLGSSMSIRDAIISSNVGFGLIATTRSSVAIQSSTIQNNVAFAPSTGDGIRLVFGSALFASAPIGTVTGNAGFGLLCTDGESSVINTALLGVVAIVMGSISPACTGF